jgi:hypothetical protein
MRPFGRRIPRQEDNIKMDLKEVFLRKWTGFDVGFHKE